MFFLVGKPPSAIVRSTINHRIHEKEGNNSPFSVPSSAPGGQRWWDDRVPRTGSRLRLGGLSGPVWGPGAPPAERDGENGWFHTRMMGESRDHQGE